MLAWVILPSFNASVSDSIANRVLCPSRTKQRTQCMRSADNRSRHESIASVFGETSLDDLLTKTSTTEMFDGDTVIVKAKTNFLAVIISAKPSSTSAITVQALGRRAGYNANEFFRDYSSAYQQVPILQCHWIPSTISQRVIANRIENPHGEDSDEVYIVDETELGMPCDVLVSKIRVPNLEGEEEKEEDH